MSNSPYSIVEYFREHEAYRCGYCKGKDTSYSIGMWAHKLTVEDYQNLIDRGWRRSGKYCYKPSMQKTCCPQYTIRCNVMDFKLSKSQKKVLKRMHNYLANGIQKTKEESETSSSANEDGVSDDHIKEAARRAEERMENRMVEVEIAKSDETVPKPERQEVPCSEMSCPDDEVATKEKLSRTEPRKGSGCDPDRPPCKKAKLIRRERRLQKLMQKGEGSSEDFQKLTIAKKSNEPKSLEDFLNEPLPENPAHKLEIRTVSSSPQNSDFKASFAQSYSVYSKYQVSVHRDPPEKCSERQFTRFLITSPLQIKVIRSHPPSPEFISMVGAEYDLYKSYQMIIHREAEDECGESTFRDFLVVSPLQREQKAGFPYGFGSFHQQYWLDGKLIAVGVIDILPRCLSSVYLFYDPDYSFLSLGTYASLREIAFVRELQKKKADLKYYYMGFYIHSCPKMRYKGHYCPSYLLCPEAYTWHPIERCLPKLDVSKYSRLDEDSSKEDVDGSADLHEVMVLYERKPLPYPVYGIVKDPDSPDDKEEVLEYARLVGKKCARSLLLFRS